MIEFTSNSPLDIYRVYLDRACPALNNEDFFSNLTTQVEQTNWEEPTSAFDLNNFAVIALIEAEFAEDISLKAFNIEIALEALRQGATLQEYPLCSAHLALARSMIGEIHGGMEIAFSTFINSLQDIFNAQGNFPVGLVYLPTWSYSSRLPRSNRLQKLLLVEEGHSQILLLLAEALCHSRLVFYNASGRRFLQLATQFDADSAGRNLQLGLASLMNQKWEGLFYLQKAQTITPESSPILQALHLAYRRLNNQKTAQFWLEKGYHLAQTATSLLPWKWTELEVNHPFTYVPFEDNLLLTVEANLGSIVTSVLIAEGDWFEAEVEFWRDQLKPGMTVIDVGASVGIYTFSAASRVGSTGKVISIEPFSGCTKCLEETRRVNEFSWVSIYAGAASDFCGTGKLALHNASELNEVIAENSDSYTAGSVEEITCFTLDSVIEQEQLERVDWLKIDAEGHEMKVLAGSEWLLSEFAPNILYENIAGNRSSNLPMAKKLQEKGYQLFCYQPFLKQLLPISSLEDLSNQLNIIALSPKTIRQNLNT